VFLLAGSEVFDTVPLQVAMMVMNEQTELSQGLLPTVAELALRGGRAAVDAGGGGGRGASASGAGGASGAFGYAGGKRCIWDASYWAASTTKWTEFSARPT
jgi:hypothetical protein